MTPPRVLVFLHSFEPGGVERDALRLAADWQRHGVDVVVVLGRREGRLADEAPPLTYDVLQRGTRSTAWFETLFMIARLPQAIRRWRPDVILCAGNTYSIVALAMRLRFGRACPPIVLKVSNDLERRDLPWITRRAYHLWLRVQTPVFAHIVAMARPALAEIERRMTPPPDRLSVIPNASLTREDVARFAAAREAAAETRAARTGRHFLSIGRLVHQKHQTLLIEAFARIARPDDRLTIVGEGPERARLEGFRARLGLETQVALPGHSRALAEHLALADAFVLSSRYEGLGVVVVEALAAGVPVVATDCCVNMPSLVDGAGLLVPRGDVAALAAAMERIGDCRVDVLHMRARAQTFTVEATSAPWLALFDRLRARQPACARAASSTMRPAL